MLSTRVLLRVGLRAPLLAAKPLLASSRVVAAQHGRGFFWGRSGDGDGKGGGDDGKKGGPGNRGKEKEGEKEKEEKSEKREGAAVEEEGLPSVTPANELLVPARETTPERMPIGENAPRPPQLLAVPIARRPVFPGFMAPLVVTDEALIQALMTVKGTSRPFVGLFMVNDPAIDLQNDKFSLRSIDQIHRVGVMAHVQQLEAGPAGAIAMVMAHRRVRITGTATRHSPPLVVRVDHLGQPPLASLENAAAADEIKATCNEILATLRDIIRVNPLFQQHIAYFARKIDVTNPYALADFAASLTTLDAKDLQEVLETVDLRSRLQKALLMLKKEQQLSALQASIKADVEKRIDKQQRKYFLSEQLKSIKKELGLEKDDKEALIQKFNDRVAKLALPPTAKQVYDEELEKLSLLERNSSEFNVTRAYLDWITSLPWGTFSKDNFDIAAASGILDEDHYGMQDVKERILEFIAVGKLKGSVQGKILCLVGPPGVGKTSIAKSIARALNRQYYRFSVGGLSDVAEIKGHRRTYIGAMPGKLIQCLKATGVSNPLVLIDEIDKIGVGRGHSGDPSSALLEMLDPNQNGAFMDHYLDTPVDASKVLFMCTANTLDTIPGPLLDRMEIIRLSGYDAPEKMEIVRRYLDPKTRVEMGLEKGKPTTPASLQLTDDAIEHLIRWYARESGVRNLEKLIGKIYRKAAAKIVAAREKAVAARKAAEEEERKRAPAAAAAGAVESAEEGSSGALGADAPAPGASTSGSAVAAVLAGADPSVTPTVAKPIEVIIDVASPPADAGVGAAEDDERAASALAAAESSAGKGAGSGSAASSAGGSSGSGESSSDAAAEVDEAARHAAAQAAAAAARAKEEADAATARAAEEALWASLGIEDAAWTVTPDNLEAYVGKPLFTSDRLYDVPPAGVVMGLAWTNMGGSALYIEVASPYLRRAAANGSAGSKKAGGKKGAPPPAGGGENPVIVDTPRGGSGGDGEPEEDYVEREPEDGGGKGGKDIAQPSGGSLRLTGKMGEVMQESAQIAYTFSRRFLRSLPGQEENAFLDTTPLHMHVPEGATPKDGPSAGVTMTTALLSVAMDRPPRADVAMTGEIDLMGTVMPVGGIREKTMAARRAGVRCLVFPKANKRDYDELPAHLKEGLEVHFAAKYEEVARVVFPAGDAPAASAGAGAAEVTAAAGVGVGEAGAAAAAAASGARRVRVPSRVAGGRDY